MMIPFNPGLVPHHDIRSERYPVALGLDEARLVEPFKPVKKHWTVGWDDAARDQGPTPRCTAYGPLTAISCTPIPHKGRNPVLDPQLMYEENQAFDRAHGRHFAQGATTIAAMETLIKHNIIKAYFWGWTMEDLFRALAKKVVVTGTMITRSMFAATQIGPNGEAVIRANVGVSRWAGGHSYAISGYSPTTGLLEIPQTWGVGCQYLPDEDYYQLLRRDGEFTMMHEIRPKV